MKMKINWHEECLKNQLRSLSCDLKEINELKKGYELRLTSAKLYSAQIEIAKKENKDGFDRDKYAIRRLCV